MDIVDNGSDFESKIRALISKVAWSIGIDIGDRLTTGARKLKFVINGPLPSEAAFPEGFRDFEVYFQREFILHCWHLALEKAFTYLLTQMVSTCRCAIITCKRHQG